MKKTLTIKTPMNNKRQEPESKKYPSTYTSMHSDASSDINNPMGINVWLHRVPEISVCAFLKATARFCFSAEANVLHHNNDAAIVSIILHIRRQIGNILNIVLKIFTLLRLILTTQLLFCHRISFFFFYFLHIGVALVWISPVSNFPLSNKNY